MTCLWGKCQSGRQRYIPSAHICPKQTFVGFAAIYVYVVHVLGEYLFDGEQ